VSDTMGVAGPPRGRTNLPGLPAKQNPGRTPGSCVDRRKKIKMRPGRWFDGRRDGGARLAETPPSIKHVVVRRNCVHGARPRGEANAEAPGGKRKALQERGEKEREKKMENAEGWGGDRIPGWTRRHDYFLIGIMPPCSLRGAGTAPPGG